MKHRHLTLLALAFSLASAALIAQAQPQPQYQQQQQQQQQGQGQGQPQSPPPGPPQEQTNWQQQIRMDQIEGMFANMRAKAPFNVDGPLLWGYYFFDSDKGKLDRAAQELAGQGYRVAAIEQTGPKVFRLRVERVERLTPQSLYSRNQYFYALVERLGIDLYDGVDAGPVQSPGR